MNMRKDKMTTSFFVFRKIVRRATFLSEKLADVIDNQTYPDEEMILDFGVVKNADQGYY